MIHQTKVKKWVVLSALVAGAVGCGPGKYLTEAPKRNLEPEYQAGGVGQVPNPSSEPWTVQALQLKQVWQQYPGAKTTRVMVIGTGIDYTHPELADSVEVRSQGGKSKIGYDFVENADRAFDLDGADTRVAGVIGAAHDGRGVSGILSQVSMIPVRYIDAEGGGSSAGLVRALRMVAQVKPTVAFLRLVNLPGSWGLGQALPEALDQIAKAGIPLVVAAGQSAKDIGALANGAVLKNFMGRPGIVIVTSIDENDQRPWITNFSGQFVHTTAPGKAVWTTERGGGLTQATGTDIAAAHVASAIALAYTHHGNQINLASVTRALVDARSSDAIPGLRPFVLGGNKLNVLKYVASF
jgi:hypothetical protein